MNTAFDKKLKSMGYEELEEYVDRKKYTQLQMDFCIDVIEQKNKLINELYDICNKQNKCIKDIEIKKFGDSMEISCARVELINKKLQQLATEIR
ncbi:hypothetical protein ACSVC9_12050 [Clostridium sp. LBM24168]